MCGGITASSLLSFRDTSRVTTLYYMYERAIAFTADISAWWDCVTIAETHFNPFTTLCVAFGSQ